MPDKTKLQLAQALREKMQTKPLQKITIQEIANACNLNRQTFYYHFHDIYELLRWMLEEEAQNILKGRLTSDTWTDVLRRLVQFLEENAQVCRSALEALQYDTIHRFLRLDIEPIVKELVDEVAAGMQVEERFLQFLTHFYTISIAAQLLDWMEGGQKELQITGEELVQMLDITIGGTIRQALERYSMQASEKP